MTNIKKNLRLQLASLFNKVIVDKTPDEEIQELIKRLHPFTSHSELIRIGSAADGGYLLPDDLEGIELCFSPGVAADSSFELACADRGMRVFLADRSVDGPAAHHEAFEFSKKFIGAVNDGDYMTLDRWVETSVGLGEDEILLQVDIEGFEYETILSMSEALLRRCRIIVCEFHRLDHWWVKPHFALTRRVFEKVLQTHSCVHLHPNNARGSIKKKDIEMPLNMEFTFLRNDRFRQKSKATRFPHPMDRPNLPGKKDIELPACWFDRG